MRKIVHRAANHNIMRRVALVLLLAALMLCGPVGCGDQKTGPNGKSDADIAAMAQTEPATGSCQITVNARPWVAFHDLADRLAAGQTVPRSELEAYGDLPAVAAWRHSLKPSSPTTANIANWMEGAWEQKPSHSTKQKVKRDHRIFGHNYRYSQSRSPEITALVAEFSTPKRTCRFRELVDQWLGPELAPRPLVLNLLPTMAEIRVSEGELFVDTGVLHAGGIEQTERQIVALLYRNLAAVPGANPIESDGEQAIAECIRVMMNEGVAGWIDQTPQTAFSTTHPTLGDLMVIPEEFFRSAQQTVTRFNTLLPEMLADPAVMNERGRDFARSIAAAGAFTNTGIAMAEVIAGRLGEERLRQVCQSVPDFFAAYQEAARLNATPIPEPGTAGISLFESVAALDEDVFDSLHELLVRQKGAQ